MNQSMSLIDQYKILHQAGHFPGHSIQAHVEAITALVRTTSSKTLLDYGCGKGQQYISANLATEWGCRPYLYDPAIVHLSRKPKGKFDGVICTDVLEHIPEEELLDVLRELFNYARKFAFFSICTRAAKKTLPDGRNCHLTIKPEEWWLSLIAGLEPAVLYEVRWNN